MKTRLSSKGQIVLPATLREQDKIAPGDEFEIDRVRAGQYLLKRVRPTGCAGLVDWLLAAPEKGWFQEIKSEGTDAL